MTGNLATSNSILAAIIDLDGTMIDTIGDFAAALNAVLVELTLPTVSREFIALTVGKGSEHLIRATLAHVGGHEALYGQAWARYQQHYEAINGKHSETYPGVEAGLRNFKARGLKLVCLTNKPTAFARELLRIKRLDHYFIEVFGGDTFERKKPDPLPLIKTCEFLGTSPSRTLMVGDSSNDARAARAAGCLVVLVSYGYNHGEPVSDVDADGVVDRLDQL